MFKRLISVTMLLVLVATLVPGGVLATDGEEESKGLVVNEEGLTPTITFVEPTKEDNVDNRSFAVGDGAKGGSVPTDVCTYYSHYTDFSFYSFVYSDKLYEPNANGQLYVQLSAHFESYNSLWQPKAQAVELYIYDNDAGSSMLLHTYPSALSFNTGFYVGNLNPNHDYYFKLKKPSLYQWNKLDGYLRVNR